MGSKREMTEYVRSQASALILAMDLGQLLGDTVFEQQDQEMLDFCEAVQRQIADEIVSVRRRLPQKKGGQRAI